MDNNKNIDFLVENIAYHAIFSFIDLYLGYDEIKLTTKDQSKTSLTIPWGTFYCTVMTFGLKNAKTIYERVTNSTFHD